MAERRMAHAAVPSDKQLNTARSVAKATRLAAAADVKAAIESICARRNVKADVVQTHEGNTAACAPWIMEQIGQAIGAERLPLRKLPSGAGHDGMAMIDLTDIGMLFVRCNRSISHNPAEAITLEDAEIFSRVFLRFIESFKPATGN